MTDLQFDILKTAMDWAKTEIISSAFFAAFGIGFLIASYCFWQMGKTDTAKAYVIPFLVVGLLLVILGVGLVIANQMRLADFPIAHSADAKAFIAMELARADKTISGYHNALWRVIPVIIILSAVLVMILKSPIWQASLIAVIAMMAIIMLVDSNAVTRHDAYRSQLVAASSQ